jgi:hypothetical protein
VSTTTANRRIPKIAPLSARRRGWAFSRPSQGRAGPWEIDLSSAHTPSLGVSPGRQPISRRTIELTRPARSERSGQENCSPARPAGPKKRPRWQSQGANKHSEPSTWLALQRFDPRTSSGSPLRPVWPIPWERTALTEVPGLSGVASLSLRQVTRTREVVPRSPTCCPA